MNSVAVQDFEAHNDEVRRVWSAYRAGKPTRVPMFVGANPRYTTFGHPANPRNLSIEQYWSDPQLMLERHLEHVEWCAFNLMQDAEMGLPEAWTVGVDFQNVYEAAALGCPIQYVDGQVPDTMPILHDKAQFATWSVPDPLNNPFWSKVWTFHNHFRRREAEGYEWRGRPIKVAPPTGCGTDGPLTGACNVRGAVEFCLDLLEDPSFANDLLAFLTEAIVSHVSAFRRELGLPEKQAGWGYADDSIALLSTEMTLERIVPHHRRLSESLGAPGPISIHLCGNATRHFSMLKRELNVMSFDTGFPVDFAALRDELGDDVEIVGGPSVPFLSSATAEATYAETRRILESGVRKGGRFVLREGNNLAPEIAPENVAAMYRAVREHGKYEEGA